MSTHDAGQDLDRLIAEQVMGWCVMTKAHPEAPTIGYWPAKEHRFDLQPRFVRDWQPSTNIAHAWEVVERLGLSVTFWPARGGGLDHFWAAGGYPFEKSRLALEATAPTAPLAICRAALRAVAVADS